MESIPVARVTQDVNPARHPDTSCSSRLVQCICMVCVGGVAAEAMTVRR